MADRAPIPTVVVPAFGRPDSTRRALRSLAAAGATDVVLVDDEGRGHGDELLAEFPWLDLVRSIAPVYWTGAIRLGVERAIQRGAPAILFFNQDVTVHPGYFARLARTAGTHPGAIVGSVALYAQRPGLVWSAGARMEWFGRGFRVLYHHVPRQSLPEAPFPVDWLHGMGTYVPSEIFSRIGLPDAERFPMAWGDADFTLRASRASIPVMCDPGLVIVHEVGSYDARICTPPSAAEYLRWLRDPRSNISLATQVQFWRRHGPRRTWPASFALRTAFLAANWVRIRFFLGRSGSAG